MSITFAPSWSSLPAVEWHGQTCVHRPWITQTLLFSCECDQLDIAPEGDPSLLGAPCDAENRLYCQNHRCFRLVPVHTRRVSESSLHECGIGQTVLSQTSLASRNDQRWGRRLKCLSLHCIDCVSTGQGTLSSQKDQLDHIGRKQHKLACCTSFFKLLLNPPDSNPRPLMKRVLQHNAGRSVLISEEANILAHLLHQDPLTGKKVAGVWLLG